MSHPDNCPKCGSNWNAGDILEVLSKQDYFKDKTREEMLELVKASYRYTPDEPKYFYRVIGIYDRDRDRTVSYECPDCRANFPRDFGDHTR